LLLLNVFDERQATQSLAGLERLKKIEQLDVYYFTNLSSSMGEMMAARWSKPVRAAIETRGKLENVRTAVAVERYRRAHGGEIPASLASLVPDYLPALPRDPMDNQPLRFKKLPRGYVVYSIGADGVDNGGIERTNQYTFTNNDVTLTVEW